MSYKLIITAQYSENYAAFNDDWDGVKTAWKCKGGESFAITMDSTDRLYLDESTIVAAAHSILAQKSGNVYRYEYVGHEFVDAHIEDITNEFWSAVKQLV